MPRRENRWFLKGEGVDFLPVRTGDIADILNRKHLNSWIEVDTLVPVRRHGLAFSPILPDTNCAPEAGYFLQFAEVNMRSGLLGKIRNEKPHSVCEPTTRFVLSRFPQGYEWAGL